MSNEATIQQFFQQVHDMRQAQQHYFKFKTQLALKAALAKEKEVDRLLAQAKEKGIIKAAKPPTQLSMHP